MVIQWRLVARRDGIVYNYFVPGADYTELRVAMADGTLQSTLWFVPRGYSAETPDWGP